MALANVVIPTSEVDLYGEKVRVRGLSYFDIASAVQRHWEAAVNIADRAMDAAGADGADGITYETLVVAALREAPELVADLVVSALVDEADVGAARQVFANLDAASQTALVFEVLSLTFKSEAEVKKLLAQARTAMEALSAVLEGETEDLQKQLPKGA